MDLELSILSCLIQIPELFKKSKLKNEHFKKHQKLWIYTNAMYQKFGDNMDLQLMVSMARNKYKLMYYLEDIADYTVSPSKFDTYQEQLINLREEGEKETWMIEKIYELASHLYARGLSVSDFIKEMGNVEEEAKQIFEEEKQ